MARRLILVCSALLAISTSSAMNITSFTQLANLNSENDSIMEGGSIKLSCGVDREVQHVRVLETFLRLPYHTPKYHMRNI